MKKWLLLLATAFFAIGLAHAQEAPDVLIKRMTNEVINIAQTDKDIQKGNLEKISKLVDEKVMPHVDFRKTTSLAVGKYWRQATDAQKESLIKEFRDLLFYTYASAISKVNVGPKIEFKKLRAKEDATDVTVDTRIILPKNPEPILLSYRLEKQDTGWKIYDINVLGAWLVETYKSSFTSEISKSGIDGLIKTLHDKNAALAKSAKK